MSDVRVRFAPSPTGFFHIGSARTALFNWLYARHTGGKFILRIEDTDKERNTQEALDVLLKGMRWLGLDWDEGPEVGGDCGPYFQSQREDIYKKYFERLKETGRTYEKEGAVFFKISGEPQVIEDAIRGRVERIEEKDFVIIRSNGTPVFHFVNVVDDITMGITHVIRGEDHLSNTSKHTELFKAFGVKPPIFAHIPLILKSNGPGKMSKRDEGALIEEYASRHFLPEALCNYLCLLGWSPKDDREILPLKEVIELFDLKGVNKNNARFDEKKLSHINGEYVRALPIDELAEVAKPSLEKFGAVEDAYLKEVLTVSQEKLRSLEEIPNVLGFFFDESFPIDPKVREKVFKKGDPATRLKEVVDAFKGLGDFSPASIEAAVGTLAEANGVGAGQYMQPMRLAVSGQGVGPNLYPMLSVLGQDRVCERISEFVRKHNL